MRKRLDPVLILTLGITVALMAGSVWLISQASGNFTALFGGTAPAGSDRTGKIDDLTLLGDTFSGYSTFRNADFQEALKVSGLRIKYGDEFDQAKRAELLNQGKADLIVTTLDQFIKQQPQGKIIGLIDRTAGADAVVLNSKQYPSLKSLLDLNTLMQQTKAKGQSLGIAFAGDTPSEYLALVLDTKFDAFNLSDFTITRVADASEALKLMQDPKQNVAIAVLWEPFVTQARQQGQTVVLSSKDAPGAIVDVLVASDRLIQSQPQALSDLLETYYRRIDANMRDSTQLQQQIADDGKLSVNDAAAVMQGIEFFTATEAQNWLKDGTLERRIASTAAVLVLAGRLDRVPEKPSLLFTNQFLTKAANNTQTLVELVRADNPELADRLAGKTTTLQALPKVQATQIQAGQDIGNLQVRGEVSFAVGSAQLTEQSSKTLENLSQEIKEFNDKTVAVRVIGHTSQTGTASVNQALSQQRAQVVVDFLRRMGVQHNIVAEGKGFSQPLANIPPQDARNQRTEIRLVRIQ
ncbi:MAG: phosphate ABC transporter substrate-binding/OmpA family protein [Oculatellaceae cyanobacterium Prado106]|nr:phosphate ABC transporter substrate-binding/OmpA family protein [Oculatellaceae cyanobacterium Prado106]